ncbi:MAG: ribosome maturation factor RimM [Thermacetogeniaceae bacterium]
MRSVDQQYITIGEIGAPHGCRGEVRVMPLTDFPERFKTTEHVFLSLGNSLVEKAVESAVIQQNHVVLKLEGIDSVEQARQFRGALLQVSRQELWPLQDGAYYHFEIVGLKVVTVGGSALGEVTEILTTGGNDVYVVKGGLGEEYLVPALRSVVKKIDTGAGLMIIEPPPGLLSTSS